MIAFLLERGEGLRAAVDWPVFARFYMIFCVVCFFFFECIFACERLARQRNMATGGMEGAWAQGLAAEKEGAFGPLKSGLFLHDFACFFSGMIARDFAGFA